MLFLDLTISSTIKLKKSIYSRYFSKFKLTSFSDFVLNVLLDMKNKIHILSSKTRDLLCAGPIITSVFDIVKELVENSLDSCPKNVFIRLVDNGIRLIEVSDSGQGVSQEDMVYIGEKSFTSKFETNSNLSGISSFGFRGLAIHAISSVSGKTKILSKKSSSLHAFLKVMDPDISGNISSSIMPAVRENGTTVSVDYPLKKFPVRVQEMKKNISKIPNLIKNLITRYYLMYPSVRFNLVLENQGAKFSKGKRKASESNSHVWQAGSSTEKAIENIFGKSALESLVEFSIQINLLDVHTEAFIIPRKGLVKQKEKQVSKKAFFTVLAFSTRNMTNQNSALRDSKNFLKDSKFIYYINNRPVENLSSSTPVIQKKVLSSLSNKSLVSSMFSIGKNWETTVQNISDYQPGYFLVLIKINTNREYLDLNVCPKKNKIGFLNSKILFYVQLELDRLQNCSEKLNTLECDDTDILNNPSSAETIKNIEEFHISNPANVNDIKNEALHLKSSLNCDTVSFETAVDSFDSLQKELSEIKERSTESKQNTQNDTFPSLSILIDSSITEPECLETNREFEKPVSVLETTESNYEENSPSSKDNCNIKDNPWNVFLTNPECEEEFCQKENRSILKRQIRSSLDTFRINPGTQNRTGEAMLKGPHSNISIEKPRKFRNAISQFWYNDKEPSAVIHERKKHHNPQINSENQRTVDIKKGYESKNKRVREITDDSVLSNHYVNSNYKDTRIYTRNKKDSLDVHFERDQIKIEPEYSSLDTIRKKDICNNSLDSKNLGINKRSNNETQLGGTTGIENKFLEELLCKLETTSKDPKPAIRNVGFLKKLDLYKNNCRKGEISTRLTEHELSKNEIRVLFYKNHFFFINVSPLRKFTVFLSKFTNYLFFVNNGSEKGININKPFRKHKDTVIEEIWDKYKLSSHIHEFGYWDSKGKEDLVGFDYSLLLSISIRISQAEKKMWNLHVVSI
ncbi:hypothetical protein BB560_003069 [Smittium megazygosporum]|uniref:Histidine kinase/HSP90-like ATPase domain-containing protein n=1 Tax=Smittium megazygosporum TaxID=133381 RepID=A0A2T9ZD09_9FUNG|nr:hypothetical protein BB560_003069 [Smittium megazygosporum]